MSDHPQHSPLPWKVGPVTSYTRYYERFVTNVKISSHIAAIVQGDGKEESEANAAYIVKSANAYPQLVEALKGALGGLTVRDTVYETAEELLRELGELK